MKLRCTLDGLLLDAYLQSARRRLVAVDGEEAFVMEAIEAIYYEIVAATADELLALEQAGYRLLRVAEDFEIRGKRTAS
ncbi:MAG: hypothetical protein JNM56_27800 [Planctomycetia bacterium]|nr:hypothetical protein [Planctomycetia bacterium]